MTEPYANLTISQQQNSYADKQNFKANESKQILVVSYLVPHRFRLRPTKQAPNPLTIEQEGSNTITVPPPSANNSTKNYFVFLIEVLECLCFKGAATFDVVLTAAILAPFTGAGAVADFAKAGDVIATAPSTTKDIIALFMSGSPSVFWYSQEISDRVGL